MTPTELERLRVRLNDLPRFDATGLYVETSNGRRRLATESYGFDSSSTVSLADSSTADRVVRWLASKCGVKVWCTAPSWRLALAIVAVHVGDMT